MAHAMWTGTISFGLVSIPVRLMAATSRKGVSFNLLHKECHNRIQEKRWCPECDKEITWDDVEKGYQYAKDEYVSFSPEDFESLPLPSKNILEVESFVEIDEIDPIYFDSSYFLQPDKKGNNSYNLLRTALEKKKMVAVGKIALRTKERLCIVRVYGSHLVVETLLYPDEINMQDEEIAKTAPSKQELSIAEHLVDLMTSPFDPEQYKDNYREALEELVEAKVSGSGIKAPAKKATTGKVLDLMEALRESVLSAKKGGSSSKRSAGRAGAEDDVADSEKVKAAPRKKLATVKKPAATTRRTAAPAKKAAARAKETAAKKKVSPIQRKRKAS